MIATYIGIVHGFFISSAAQDDIDDRINVTDIDFTIIVHIAKKVLWATKDGDVVDIDAHTARLHDAEAGTARGGNIQDDLLQNSSRDGEIPKFGPRRAMIGAVINAQVGILVIVEACCPETDGARAAFNVLGHGDGTAVALAQAA